MSITGEAALRQIKILWTDDEIEVLRPHIIFLQTKGYHVDTCTNGRDAVDMVRNNSYDLLFLDENMPGLSGIETLARIKQHKPALPVIMITQSEEETLMESAIGSEITDFLIKPVKPGQILLSVKKITEQRRLVNEKTTSSYLSSFATLGSEISATKDYKGWYDLYRRLLYWQAELEKSADTGLKEILESQIDEANSAFNRYISSNYTGWFGERKGDHPLLSADLMREKIFPLLKKGRPLFFIVIDNLRYDQWRAISPFLSEYYRITSEDMYMSILPTATQYSRNALFAGMMPREIRKRHPEYWIDDHEEERKNSFEDRLLEIQLRNAGIDIRWIYEKLLSNSEGKKFNDRISDYLQYDLTALIYNSVDMLSHARTDVNVMKELAVDEAAFCSVTKSWFMHSPLFETLKLLSKNNALVVITTDHGNIRVKNPVKIIGDKSTSPNLRYKHGRNLAYNSKEVFEISDPRRAELPSPNITSRYIFARGSDFLVYQNNYNYYASYYCDTFQHGGISLQEMICPLITMETL